MLGYRGLSGRSYISRSYDHPEAGLTPGGAALLEGWQGGPQQNSTSRQKINDERTTMDTFQKAYLALALVLFILNMVAAVRNLTTPEGKTYLAALNLFAAVFLAAGAINTLAEVAA
jgi:hypothetical protein